MTEKSHKHKFSIYFYNRITYIGIVIAVVFFVIECGLFYLDFTSSQSNIYLGMLTYAILPPFLLLGLFLVPLGAFLTRQQYKKGEDQQHIPRSFRVDWSDSRHRNAIKVFTVGTIILVIFSLIGAYKAFHYTESIEFCGLVCHKVMSPQYTAHQRSPHARVRCVNCHIGEGVDWYVRSKLSGARQIFKTALNQYPRPIPTPVHNLRPAKETCEECHWPKKLYSAVDFRKTYFPTEDNTQPPWHLRMLINVGRNKNEDRGIHSHMYMDKDVYYVPDDEQRQKISWVKSVDKEGRKVIYTSPDSAYRDQEPPEDKIRKMDCMDCHNRPAHHFLSPFELANDLMVSGKVSPDIPAVKERILEVLSREYSSLKEAEKDIYQSLMTHYQQNFSEFYAQNEEKVKSSVENIVDIYKEHFFPHMKARWQAYPENIGHLISPGCFRCHDGQHKSVENKKITRDCNVCHTIVEQGTQGHIEQNTKGLEFKHPFFEFDRWRELDCSNCHTGGVH